MSTDAPGNLFDAEGHVLTLDAVLGRGGEATIYSLVGDSSLALKLYHKPDATRARKLELMLKNPPASLGAGHVTLAWPLALARNAQRQVQGFLMPRSPRGALSLHQLYNPRSRRERAPGLSWAYLLRVARNLAAVVASLHARGYVIGDLNESNVLVTDRALVTLVDCDSVQVRAGRSVYRCGVGKPEYTPPELQQTAFTQVTRNPQHDNFGLAVLVFLLLMEGVHPFAGVDQGDGEPPSLAETIQLGQTAFFGRCKLTPPLSAPAINLLPTYLQKHFARAFRRPYWRRPSAKSWQAILTKLEASLTQCTEPQHVYSTHLQGCPWCERRDKLGLDAFPATAKGSSHTQLKQVSPRKTQIRPAWPQLLRHFPLVTALPLVGLISLASGRFGHLLSLSALLGSLVLLSTVRLSHSRRSRQPRLYSYLKKLELGLEALLTGIFVAVGGNVLLSYLLRVGTLTNSYSLFGLPLFVLGFALLWRFRGRSLSS